MGRYEQGRFVDGLFFPKGFHCKHGAYYYVDSRHKWHHLGADYRLALDAYHARVNPSSAPGLVSDLLSRYISTKRGKRSPYTIADYDKWSASLDPVFGHMSVDSVTPEMLVEYLDHRGSGRQARGEMQLLRSAYRWARKKKFVSSVPTDGLDDDEMPQRQRRSHLPDCADVWALYAYSPPRLQAYIRLKLAVASREGDLLALRASDISRTSLAIRIRKTGGTQSIDMTPGLRDVLDQVLALPRRAGWLFERRGGRSYFELDDPSGRIDHAWYSVWSRAKASTREGALQCGRVWTPLIDTDLRAYAAALAYRRGGLDAARELLAHADPRQTLEYLRAHAVIKTRSNA